MFKHLAYLGLFADHVPNLVEVVGEVFLFHLHRLLLSVELHYHLLSQSVLALLFLLPLDQLLHQVFLFLVESSVHIFVGILLKLDNLLHDLIDLLHLGHFKLARQFVQVHQLLMLQSLLLLKLSLLL